MSETSVIAFCNKARTYRNYNLAGERPSKPERARLGEGVKLSRHHQTL